MNKNICFDRIKYGLMNVCKMHGKDCDHYVRQKLSSFNSIFHLKRTNDLLDKRNQAQHLYALVYAKYYSQRGIIMEKYQEKVSNEDDEYLQKKFKVLLQQTVASSTEFENHYLAIIKDIKTPEIFQHYEALNKKFLNGKLDDEELALFYDYSQQTEVFLEKKIEKDIQFYASKREKIFKFLNDYRFVNGWIIASGITILSTVLTYKKFFY